MTQFAPILPEIILTVGAVVLMMVAAFGGPRSGPFVSWAAVAIPSTPMVRMSPC